MENLIWNLPQNENDPDMSSSGLRSSLILHGFRWIPSDNAKPVWNMFESDSLCLYYKLWTSLSQLDLFVKMVLNLRNYFQGAEGGSIMNRKSSLIAVGFITAFLLVVTFFTSNVITLAQPDLCSVYARQYADRYADPGGNTPRSEPGGQAPGASSGGILRTPRAGASSNINWSLRYDHAYNWCMRDMVLH
jgi:hypothetical protein